MNSHVEREKDGDTGEGGRLWCGGRGVGIQWCTNDNHMMSHGVPRDPLTHLPCGYVKEMCQKQSQD